MAPRRNRSSAAVSIQPATRCAIYCRVSTDDRLDQDFNSLDAQHEAAENYIRSQRHENWVASPEHYDDGGFSGGTVQRPALKRLLADVELGKIDCIVVYKYDRLSRSMLDFLQLLDSFKRHGVSFVSVSQRFDTSTPVGEMTLNILLSFAQFERQIIAERTRDKMSAARRRGKWTGGMPPLGYDVVPEGGRIVANADEAATVRAVFDLYVEKASLTDVVQELNRRGWRRKSWRTKGGKIREGKTWTRPTLRQLLTDPLYVGLQKLGDETFPGEHKGIVPKKLFDQVQCLLNENRSNGGSRGRNLHGALLRGLLRCAACDRAMSHTWTRPKGRLHRYYACQRQLKEGAGACPTRSIPADKVEAFVIDQIRRIGASPGLQEATFREAVAQVKAQRRGLRAEAKRLQRELAAAGPEVERLVSALTHSDGPAAEAIRTELEKAQSQATTLRSRLVEIEVELTTLDAQAIDRDDLARALEAFDPIWDVLLVPERERVLQLLIERIDYESGKMTINWRLAGFGELAREVAP